MKGQSSPIGSRHPTTFAAVIASILLLAIGQTASGQWEEIRQRGRQEYLAYCATCHGEAGKGDGPMAKHLASKPSNLTLMSKRYYNQFPFWHIYGVVDGRAEVKMHGPRTMPVWGDRFTEEQGAEAARPSIDLVRGRIWQLVVYLQSIQE